MISQHDLLFARLTAHRWKLDLDNYADLQPLITQRSIGRELRILHGIDWSKFGFQQIHFIKQ